MKRILFISPNLGVGGGGAERQIVSVAILLKENGHYVEFYCYGLGDFYAETLNNLNIKVNWNLAKNPLKRILEARAFIRSGKYDAVISFLQTPNFLNNISAIGGKSWKVITGERSAKEESFDTVRGHILGWFQRYSDTIVCNSYNAKCLWMAKYSHYSNKLCVIYNYIHLNSSINSQYIPKKNKRLNIVIAASYQYLKNPIALANAISLMTKEEQSLINVSWYGRKEITKGDTGCFDEVYRIVERNNLSNVFHLNSETKDIINIMNTADVVALFSRVEGLPNVICEGMILGKPIIMSRVSDYQVLIDETNGILCDSNNPLSIKYAILKMASFSNDKLKEMGISSKRKATSLFSKEQIIGHWESVL